MTASISQNRSDYGFNTEVRVRLSETDAVGIVYFGSFSTYLDVGRMDYLSHLALDQQRFVHHAGHIAHLPPGAVANVQLQFHRPARYKDTLLVHVRVAKIGRTSYTFHMLVTDKRVPQTIATGELTLVWLDEAFRPAPIPDEFRSAIEAFEAAQQRSQGHH